MLTYRKYKYYYPNTTFKSYLKNVVWGTIKKYSRIPYCTYMCIKYPFLYPRNRFTGTHHANILSSVCNNLFEKSILDIGITGKLVKDKPTHINKYFKFFDNVVKLDVEGKKLTINNNIDSQYFDLKPLMWEDDKFEIVDMKVTFAYSGRPLIILKLKTIDENDNTNYGFSYYSLKLKTNKCKYRLYKVLNWIDEKILDKIFILPTYTEWDAVEPGWNKAFGKQYLKELKTQLKKDNMLYKWRITDIKEKFGRFQLYCNYGSDELYRIINKYEDLSWNTCINCGKPATHTSKGWISPYCDDCVNKDTPDRYTKRTDNNKNGYTENMIY